jgi:hypothetical protein
MINFTLKRVCEIFYPFVKKYFSKNNTYYEQTRKMHLQVDITVGISLVLIIMLNNILHYFFTYLSWDVI